MNSSMSSVSIRIGIALSRAVTEAVQPGEILFVAETGLWIPLEVEVLEASDTQLRARARGAAVEVSPSMVKAATFHGLEVVETAEGFSAEVILDV